MFKSFSKGRHILPENKLNAKKTLFQNETSDIDVVTCDLPEKYKKNTAETDLLKYLIDDISNKFDKSYDLSNELLPIFADIKRFRSSKNIINDLINNCWESKSIETVEMFTKLLFELSTIRSALVYNYLYEKSKIFLKPYPSHNEENLKQHTHMVEMVHIMNRIYIKKEKQYLETLFKIFTSIPNSSQDINVSKAYLRNFLRLSLYIPEDYKGKVLSIIGNYIDSYYIKLAEDFNDENFLSLQNEVLNFLEEVYKPLSDRNKETEQSFTQFLLKWFHDNLTSSNSSDSSFKWIAIFQFYLISIDYQKQTNKSSEEMILFHVLQMSWQQVLNESLDVEARQSAVNFIGSLVVHANYIPDSCIRNCLGILCFWLHSYLTSTVTTTPKAVFYAVWSVVMFILLNKLKQVLSHPLEFEFFERLNLGRIVNSQFDPLSHCDPQLVARFLEMTKFCQLVNYHPWAHSPCHHQHQDVLHLSHLSPRLQVFHQPARSLSLPITPDQLELELMDYIF